MPRLPILSGAYQSRSIISGSQRCINLYPEINDDPQAPVAVTHFPTPGLTTKLTTGVVGASRCTYRATNGQLFIVVGTEVYFVSSAFVATHLGTIPAAASPVIMSDNGLVALLVDGSNIGYYINLATHTFGIITAPNFFGGTFVACLDGFFILNVPGTNRWYISLELVTAANLTGTISPDTLYAAFDPLDVVAKNSSPDPVVGLRVMHRNIWLVGALTSEIWYNAGSADFTFGIVPGVYVEQGSTAPYSIATQDLSIFWLSEDRYGSRLVLEGKADYSVKEVSSKGIEAIFQSFQRVDDAIGGCYQLLGHAFYVLTFPTAGRTFAMEIKTKQWHELASTGSNGLERHRVQQWTFAYDMVLGGDRSNGKLYQLDPANFTDDGQPITRLRTLPHLLNNGKRMRLDRVIADLQGGTLTSATPDNPPKVFLSTSIDRGASFGNPVQGVFGAAGDYGQFPTWTNQGLSRDFVLELTWSEPINTALNGIFYESSPADS